MKRAICLYHLLSGPNCDLISDVIREYAEATRHQPHGKIHLGTDKPRTEMPQQEYFLTYTYKQTLKNKHIYLSFERLNRNYLDCFVHISHYRDIIR